MPGFVCVPSRHDLRIFDFFARSDYARVWFGSYPVSGGVGILAPIYSLAPPLTGLRRA